MIILHSMATDKGKVRERNEDFCFSDGSAGLYIICDGMGGHNGGDLAARTAVDIISQNILAWLDQSITTSEILNDQSEISEGLKAAVYIANDRLQDLIKENPALSGMGTTITLCLIRDGRGFMAHVGDSRLYLFRKNEFRQLSRDHTFVNEMVGKGLMSRDEAEKSPYAQMLLRALGPLSAVEVDTLHFDILHGDKILLCSDGLYSSLSDNDARIIFDKYDIVDDGNDAAEAFVEFAKNNDGSDNISAIVINAVASEGTLEKEQERSHEVYLQKDTLQGMFLFHGVLTEEVMKIMEIVEVQDCLANKVIIKEGDLGNSLYIILQGSVIVRKRGEEIGILTSGNHFGEMALLSNETRMATVVARENARLLVIKGKDFLSLLQREHLLGLKLMWNMASELSSRLTVALSAQ
jgi:serine/threonine protein phosphatase PrpC